MRNCYFGHKSLASEDPNMMLRKNIPTVLLVFWTVTVAKRDRCKPRALPENEFLKKSKVFVSAKGSFLMKYKAKVLESSRPMSITCKVRFPAYYPITSLLVVMFTRIDVFDLRKEIVYAIFRMYEEGEKRRTAFLSKNVGIISVNSFQFESGKSCRDHNQAKYSLVIKEKDFAGVHFCDCLVRANVIVKNETMYKDFWLLSKPVTIYTADSGKDFRMKMSVSTFGDNVLNNYRFFKCRLIQTNLDHGAFSMGFIKSEEIWQKRITEDSMSVRIEEPIKRHKKIDNYAYWRLSDDERLIRVVNYAKFSGKKGQEREMKVYTTYVTGLQLGQSSNEARMQCKYETLVYNIVAEKDNKVNMKPNWVDIQSRQMIYSVQKGSHHTIKCSCGGSPKPEGLWRLLSDDIFSLQIKSSKVFIDYETMPSTYHLQCICRNRLGEISEDITIRVYRAGLLRQLVTVNAGYFVTLIISILMIAIIMRMMMERRILSSLSMMSMTRGSAWRSRSKSTFGSDHSKRHSSDFKK